MKKVCRTLWEVCNREPEGAEWTESRSEESHSSLREEAAMLWGTASQV